MSERPFSQACENNKQPILAELRKELVAVKGVLELARGTGQHACYFAAALPFACWQMTDLPENLSGLEAWRADYSGANLPPARALDVCQADWGVEIPAAIFTANSLHIMPWSAVERLFDYLVKHAPVSNRLCIYGPFTYGGEYTSDSNARSRCMVGPAQCLQCDPGL